MRRCSLGHKVRDSVICNVRSTCPARVENTTGAIAAPATAPAAHMIAKTISRAVSAPQGRGKRVAITNATAIHPEAGTRRTKILKLSPPKWLFAVRAHGPKRLLQIRPSKVGTQKHSGFAQILQHCRQQPRPEIQLTLKAQARRQYRQSRRPLRQTSGAARESPLFVPR